MVSNSDGVLLPDAAAGLRGFTAMENVHPLQGGIFRLKFRRDRRPTFAIEPIWTFYPQYLWDTAGKIVRAVRAARHLYGLAKTIKADARKKAYMDQALAPAVEDDLDSLELFNQNDAARHAVLHERHVRKLTAVVPQADAELADKAEMPSR